MKYTVLLTSLFISVLSFGQAKDSLAVASADTVELYVINKTNKFVGLPDEGSGKYSFFYRDLKYIKEIRELKFNSKEEVTKFFETCEKAMNTDKTYITQGYNVSRNKLSKNVLRLNNKDGGYYLLKEATLDNMKKAFENSL